MTLKVLFDLVPADPSGDDRWCLDIWVAEAGDYDDPYIFVHRTQPDVPHKELGEVLFMNVATRTDMEDYDPDVPNDDTGFFRRTGMRIITPSESEIRRLLVKIKEDIELLAASYREEVSIP
jgi:hypothetical protein